MILNQESGRGEERAIATTCPRWLEVSPLVSTRSQQVTGCSSGWVSGHFHVGSPCQGVLGSSFLPVPWVKWQLLIQRRSTGRWTAESTRPWPRFTKPCFPNGSSSERLIRPAGGKAPLLGNVVLSARSAERPGRGDYVRSSPICLCKHLQGPPIKLLLFFFDRCLF